MQLPGEECLGPEPLVPMAGFIVRKATFHRSATSNGHDADLRAIRGAARRIVMDIAAAVLMFSVVLYFVQQFNVEPW